MEKEYHDNLQSYSQTLQIVQENEQRLEQMKHMLERKDAEKAHLAAIN